MKKFLFKIIIIFIGTFILSSGILIIQHMEDFTKNKFKNVPKNSLSNSISFNAKIDHLVDSPKFKNCTFLIVGSSMSLNNISGNIISQKTNECVYNISSWGLRPCQINMFLEKIDLKKTKTILLAFNNTDFGTPDFDVDFGGVGSYINNKSIRPFYFFYNFNIQTFSSSWTERSAYSLSKNMYTSIDFDETGSVQFEQKGFVINDARWNKYFDTTGFENFCKDVNKLFLKCKKQEIEFVLVYLPTRNDLLTEKYKIENKYVSENLSVRFKDSFIDLHNLNIQSNHFCDGIHFFKEGADDITNVILDSMGIRKNKPF